MLTARTRTWSMDLVAASDRRPSGLPSTRIVRPVYGSREQDVDARLEGEAAGLKRTRRTLLVACGVVVAIVLALLLAGNGDAAEGVAGVMLVPLLFVLGGVQVVVMLTRRR